LTARARGLSAGTPNVFPKESRYASRYAKNRGGAPALQPRGPLSTRSSEEPYGTDLENHPSCEPLGSRRYGTKYFSDNLAPLYRFLRGNVGRPWNKVWSELREHVAFENTVQKHILGHVFDVVERHAVLVDGDVYALERWGGLGPLRAWGWRPQLYVCPTSGLLREAKREPRRKPRVANENIVPISPDERFHRIEGIWYRERLAKAEDASIIVVSKRQLGSREIRRLELERTP
jgi:hypothetical protein